MSELYDQVQDHEDRISTLEDTSSQEQSDQSDLDQRVTDLENNAGQLQYPLTQDTIDLIKEIFPTGSVTLVAGTATISDPRISSTSNIQLTRSSAGGTLGNLSYLASPGQAVITSDNPGDTSEISYVIFS